MMPIAAYLTLIIACMVCVMRSSPAADTTPPVLQVDSPTDRMIVRAPFVNFRGTLSDEVGVTTLTINLRYPGSANRVVVPYDSDPGAVVFWGDLGLVIESVTDCIITAEDAAGNRTSIHRLIFRQDEDATTPVVVGFLHQFPTEDGIVTLTDEHFPGTTVVAETDGNGEVTRVDYRFTGATTRSGTAVQNSDGDWRIPADEFASGDTVIAVTALSDRGDSATSLMTVRVPNGNDGGTNPPGTKADSAGSRCGAGSGITGLLLTLLAAVTGLRRTPGMRSNGERR